VCNQRVAPTETSSAQVALVLLGVLALNTAHLLLFSTTTAEAHLAGELLY